MNRFYKRCVFVSLAEKGKVSVLVGPALLNSCKMKLLTDIRYEGYDPRHCYFVDQM